MKHFLMSLALVCAAASAQAGVGLTTLPGQQGDEPVTVFYPSAAPDQAVQRGPYKLQLAPESAPMRGNGRLVVLSHGSGGSAWTHTDLARKLVDAGFTVALPDHVGDNWKSRSDAGPASWRRRPHQVSRAIDAVAADPRFASLSLDKVGMFGMSAGGHTALTLAGGRWSPSALLRHCEAYLEQDFASCVGLATELNGDMWDTPKKAIALAVMRYKLDDTAWYGHEDKRIAAIVAEVPYSIDFDLKTLANPHVPLGIVQAGQDLWLVPRFHSNAVLKACKSCVLVADVPSAGHGSMMSPPPPREALTGIAGKLLSDPPGFDRALVPATHARIVDFLRQHLLP